MKTLYIVQTSLLALILVGCSANDELDKSNQASNSEQNSTNFDNSTANRTSQYANSNDQTNSQTNDALEQSLQELKAQNTEYAEQIQELQSGIQSLQSEQQQEAPTQDNNEFDKDDWLDLILMSQGLQAAMEPMALAREVLASENDKVEPKLLSQREEKAKTSGIVEPEEPKDENEEEPSMEELQTRLCQAMRAAGHSDDKIEEFNRFFEQVEAKNSG